MPSDNISNYEIRQNIREEMSKTTQILAKEKDKLDLILNKVEDQLTILKEYRLANLANKLKEACDSIEKGRNTIFLVGIKVLEILNDTKKKGDLY